MILHLYHDRNNELPRIDGEIVVGRISPRSALATFEAGSAQIISAYEQRKARRGRLPESPNDWFKRNTYRFLRAFIIEDLTRVFESAILRGSRRTFALDAIRGNPFKLGLFAMYSDASLPRNDRQIFGNQMLYAFGHDVMPEHFVGFIRAAGSPVVIAQKLKKNFREPGFSL